MNPPLKCVARGKSLTGNRVFKLAGASGVNRGVEELVCSGAPSCQGHLWKYGFEGGGILV